MSTPTPMSDKITATNSRVNRKWWRKSVPKSDHGKRNLALFQSCVIGSVAALAAVIFTHGVELLTTLRHFLYTTLPPIVVLPALGLAGGIICGALVQYIAPEITGSGIPQVKAILCRVPIKLDLRVALSKLLGGIVALGVGLPLGREGPTVQVGAAIAAVLDRMGIRVARHRRQLIAAGAGAGLAAAFNAPLAGVIFVLEELLKDVSSITIGSALLACFFAGIVSRWMGNHSLDVPANSAFPQCEFFVNNIPFCLLVGVLTGILGILFNKGIIASCRINDKIFQKRFILRVGLAGLICGTVIALLPHSFRNFAGVQQLLFEGRGWEFATAALVVNFVLTICAYGSGAPGGLFAPSLTIGAALGYLIGLFEMHFFPQYGGAPTTLALAGMGAFFTGVARVPVTATVIVFEMTADFNLLLPLMISSITSYIVAEHFLPGSVYDRLLQLQNIHLPEDQQQEHLLKSLTVEELMHEHVEILPVHASLPDATQKFHTSSHRGFPVLDGDKVVGIITQSDLIRRDETQPFEEARVQDIMTQSPVTIDKMQSLHEAITLLDLHEVSRLPVLSNGQLVGIVTRSDIIRAIATL